MNITVVSLNPCIDWQLTTPNFEYGALNHVRPVGRYAAGKGINVAIALKNLGLDPMCVGFNYQENGAELTKVMDEHSVRHDFVNINGALRTNIKLYDTANNTMTELNQPGAPVSSQELALLYDKVKAQANAGPNPDADILVLSGSMPAGVPKDFYRTLSECWKGFVILDAAGEALRLALEGTRPTFCIKPNLYELESSFNVKLPTKEAIASFCLGLLRRYHVDFACVSMGADGAMLISNLGDVHYMDAMDLDVKGVQGAGDSMVAGLTYGLSLGVPDADLLCMACAAAAATVVLEGTQMCTHDGFNQFMSQLPTPERINL